MVALDERYLDRTPPQGYSLDQVELDLSKNICRNSRRVGLVRGVGDSHTEGTRRFTGAELDASVASLILSLLGSTSYSILINGYAAKCNNDK